MKQVYAQESGLSWIKRHEARKAYQNNRRLPHGLYPNDEYMAYAFSMVKVALDQNEASRPAWVDMRYAWSMPGCASFDASFFNDNVISQWFDKRFAGIKEPIPDVFDLMTQANQEWKHPDITHLLGLVDSFIVKAFNGPIEPIPYRVMGAATYQQRTPKPKVRVTSDTAPLLKLAVLLLSWAEYKGIDLEAVDRERMGTDYELVTSGKKPSTEQGRKRKPEINNLIRKMGLSFTYEKTIHNEVEMWYHARVIRGSIAEAASDYVINSSSTFENLIRICDHIAGIR